MIYLDELLEKYGIDWADIQFLNTKDFEFVRRCVIFGIPNINTTGFSKGDYVVRRLKKSNCIEKNAIGVNVRYRVESVMFNMILARRVKGRNKYGTLRSINSLSSYAAIEMDQQYLDSLIIGSEFFDEHAGQSKPKEKL